MPLLEGRGGEMIKESPTDIGGTGSIKPKTLFHAISEIERWSYTEREAGNLPEDIITQPIYWSFMSVGWGNTFMTSLVMFLTLPLSVGVISRSFPIFGTKSPGLFDKIIALAISVGPSVATALFITLLFWNIFLGKATRKAVTSLVIHGIVIPKILFTFVAVFLYLGAAEILLSHENCVSLSYTLSSALSHLWIVSPDEVYHFLLKFRKILIKSSFVFIIFTVIKIAILMLGYIRASWKTRRFIELYTKYFPDRDKFLEVA